MADETVLPASDGRSDCAGEEGQAAMSFFCEVMHIGERRNIFFGNVRMTKNNAPFMESKLDICP